MTDTNDLNLENAKLAYTIIQGLLKSNEALSDLLVVMSHALDEDVVKAMTNTGEWESYMESKRDLDNTRKQIEKFSAALAEMEQADSEGTE